jgi:hypothetical protein
VTDVYASLRLCRVSDAVICSTLLVIAGGESLVSHAGGVLLTETARRSGLAGQLSRLLVHGVGKVAVSRR